MTRRHPSRQRTNQRQVAGRGIDFEGLINALPTSLREYERIRLAPYREMEKFDQANQETPEKEANRQTQFLSSLSFDDRQLYDSTFAKYGIKGRALFQIFKSDLPYTKEEIKDLLNDPQAVNNIDQVNQLKNTNLFTIDQIKAAVASPSKIAHIPGLIEGATSVKKSIDAGNTDYAANGNFGRMIDREIVTPGGLAKLGFRYPTEVVANQGRVSIGGANAAQRAENDRLLEAVGFQPVDHRIGVVDALKGIGNLYKEALWDSDFAQGFRFGFGNVASLGSSLLEFVPGVGEAAAGFGFLGDLIKPTGGPWDEMQSKIDSVGKWIPSINNVVDHTLDLALPPQQQHNANEEEKEEGGKISYKARRNRKKRFQPIVSGKKRMHWIMHTKSIKDVTNEQE